jgi:hypothetical protein
MPSLEKSWTHSTATAGERGICVAGTEAAAGETILMAGGWAEFVLSDNSNDSSTSETFDTSHAQIPVVGSSLEYDSGSTVQSFSMAFKGDSYTKMRMHLWIVTD